MANQKENKNAFHDAIREIENLNKGQEEFLQAVREVFGSLNPVLEKSPELFSKKYCKELVNRNGKLYFVCPGRMMKVKFT